MIEVALYGMLGVGLSIDASSRDPYDPDAVAVEVVVTAPDTPAHAWPAYWDGSAWRWRYQPQTLGAHEATVRVDGAEVDAWSFTVAPSDADGPVHVDGWGLRHPDGDPFHPLGVNLGWSAGGGVDDYAAWFAALGDHGGTAARVWVTHFTRQNPTWPALGAMDPAAAETLDAILDAAEAEGVRVILVLWQHSQLEALAWSSWASNPYNEINGGPCADSRCFFVDPEAIALQERFLRYAVARWGAHPGLLGWEVMNEIDGVSGVDVPTATHWASERADTLRALDGGLRPITWSTAIAPPPGAESLWAGTDLVQLHRYEGVELPRLLEALDTATQADAGPVLVGEWGIDWVGYHDAQDTDGLAWHNANWAALAGGAAGNAWSWWWDTHLAPDDLWWRLEGMARVIADLDLPAMGPTPVQTTPSALLARARTDGTGALVWVHDPAHTYPEPEATEYVDATLQLPALPDVRWTAWDTARGVPVAEGRTCGEPITLPAFTGDIALVIADDAERCARACGCDATGGGGSAPLLLTLLVLARRGRARGDATAG